MTGVEAGPDVGARAELLARVALFAELGPVELDRLAADCDVRRLAKGDVLWHAGDAGDELLVVVDGELAVWGEGDPGGELVARLGAGECVGELALLLDEVRSATVTCLRPCRGRAPRTAAGT